MRKGAKVAVIGGVFAVMVGGAGYGAFNFVDALSGGDGAGSSGVRTGPPSGDEVQEASEKFFAAWEEGKAAEAGALTDYAQEATDVLRSFSGAARIREVRITPTATRGRTVEFSVKAEVSYKGKKKPLSYDSELTVVRGKTTGKALVDWEPTVVHPELKKGDILVTGEASAPQIEAVDRSGTVLDKEKYPSLAPILASLREKYGDKAGGTPGVELAIRHPGEEGGDTTLLPLTEGTPGKLKTSISARAQAAAEKAVKRYPESSVVAVKPSTGEVLAVANNRKDGFNAAFLGKLPPGSTMKILSAATLIDNGITTASGPAPCPATATWQSQTFGNIAGMKPDEGATLSDSFARSCNTAFVKYADEIHVEALTKEAEERFGLGRNNWKVGVQSFDGSVPASGGPNTAANMIGQGEVTMSPLNMASVTATAITGSFRQPVIVAQSLDNRKLATAKGLDASTVQQLRQMMNRTATSGTAAKAMAGVPGSIGAKTGSAEVDGRKTADSWFTGFRDDMTAAAVVEQGGRGGEAAGPIVADVLRVGG